MVDGTWETFVYDTRNPDAPYDTSDIVTAYLRGSFNDWDQSMPMNGPDERGVYWLDTKIPTGYNEYKFYFDLGMGNNDWISDPESQNRNTSDNNNSIRTAVLDTLPSIRHLTPFMGTRAMPGDTIWIEGQRFAADDSVGFLFDPVITSPDHGHLRPDNRHNRLVQSVHDRTEHVWTHGDSRTGNG